VSGCRTWELTLYAIASEVFRLIPVHYDEERKTAPLGGRHSRVWWRWRECAGLALRRSRHPSAGASGPPIARPSVSLQASCGALALLARLVELADRRLTPLQTKCRRPQSRPSALLVEVARIELCQFSGLQHSSCRSTSPLPPFLPLSSGNTPAKLSWLSRLPRPCGGPGAHASARVA